MFNFVVVFIFGLIFGSFFNVCIHRIPRNISLIPSSHCPQCKNKIKWYHNIPLFSFCFMGGKCSNCSQKISLKYPIVELVTALFFLFIYWNLNSGFSILFVKQIVFFSLGIIIFFIDLEHKIIPDSLSIIMIVTGIAFSLFASTSIDWKHSLGGGLTGFALFLAVAFLGEFILKKECLGGGDIKLIAGIGTYLGFLGVFVAIFFASVFAVALLLIIRYDLKKAFPFGPFLIAGALFYQFFGTQLLYLYLSLWNL